jgi:hypothetical protein
MLILSNQIQAILLHIINQNPNLMHLNSPGNQPKINKH